VGQFIPVPSIPRIKIAEIKYIGGTDGICGVKREVRGVLHMYEMRRGFSVLIKLIYW